MELLNKIELINLLKNELNNIENHEKKIFTLKYTTTKKLIKKSIKILNDYHKDNFSKRDFYFYLKSNNKLDVYPLINSLI